MTRFWQLALLCAQGGVNDSRPLRREIPCLGVQSSGIYRVLVWQAECSALGTDTDVAGGKQGAVRAARKFWWGAVEQQTDQFTCSLV